MSDTTAPTEERAEDASVEPMPRRRLPGRGIGSPLFRNAFALMLNTGISAVLGLGFWLMAAHYYSESSVGQGSAAIAAMKLLAGLTAVTLTGALARFIPVAGRTTGSLVLRTYAGSSVVVAVAAGVFLLTLDLWGPSYRFLHGLLPGLGFVVAVVAWSLLTLQDGVLTGLRSALWVPVGNTVFSAVKLALLVGLAAALPVSGVFVSWVVSIAASVLPLGWLVFRRLVPAHVRATEGRGQPASYREIGRFLAGDYTGSLFSLAVVYLVPVIVAAQVDSADNAYFYITSTIGGTVNLLAINMGASLTVEGSHDPARLADNCRAALRRMAKIMVPVCVLMFALAPYILHVFGRGYAEAATPLLRWFAVGAALRVVMEVYFAVLRAQSRTAGLAYLQGLLCVLVLGLTLVLLPRMGLTGAGVAEICSLTVIAAIAAVRLRGVLKASPAGSSPTTPVPAPPDGDLADLPVRGENDPEEEGAGESGRGRLTGARRVLRSALDADTLPLGVRLDMDHPERRPDVRPVGAPSKAPAPPPVPGPVRRLRTPGAAVWGLLVVALALYWLPLTAFGHVDLDGMGGFGLVSVLPVATLLGAGLLIAAFACALCLPGPHRWLLAAVLVATVVCLHAVPAVLEEQPRFATAWQHLGFLDFIDRTGVAAPDLDARWSWPGFFALAAFAARACGVSDLGEVLRWWPLAVQLLYLAPLVLLVRTVRADWRAKWTALWLFVLCGWVGQDYFSPQSLNYFFYLLFVAVLVVWFRWPGQLRGKRLPGEQEVAPAGRGTSVALLALVIALFAASVASHQLTPFVMLGVLTALVLARRLTPAGLPLLCTVLLAVWVGFLAEPYWSGHFDDLFGGLGSLGGNVSASVSGRIQGGSATHKAVLYVRVALAAGVLVCAALGWWRRRRAGLADVVLPVLAAVPFLAFGMQSYGGEVALRVFLFALPGACALAALALFPRPDARGAHRYRGPLAALLAGLVLVMGFLVARWGNEPFERVRPGEVAAMDYVYGHDTPTVRLLWPSSNTADDVTPAIPWGAREMERVLYQPVLAPRDPARAGDLVGALGAAGSNAYLIVSRGQSEYLELSAGYAPGWRQQLLRSLDGRPELHRVLANDDAVLYELKDKPAGTAAAPRPGPPGPRVTWTPVSVVGALAALALLVLLTVRELVRVGSSPGVRQLRLLQGSFWFALPLLLVVAGSLAWRLVTLS
ncbi:polysaccharide biosynthesis C-terminal domain-containing protein [Streptomyces sp. NPDC049585]|uniref:polysaccharide biosynthesis C-terminal domain-containing protein n=1 Tax=Streptomyces sp. NPDC049585 TaxID=3155154 RepID=UPI0034191647